MIPTISLSTALESDWCIFEIEWHSNIFMVSVFNRESRFWNALLIDFNLMESTEKSQGKKYTHFPKLSKISVIFAVGYRSSIVLEVSQFSIVSDHSPFPFKAGINLLWNNPNSCWPKWDTRSNYTFYLIFYFSVMNLRVTICFWLEYTVEGLIRLKPFVAEWIGIRH